ncbi:hypothetical protein [Clostridium psychrophilum]|nr:hypothetical protein [Clostridium psychrophilum]
MAAVIVAKAAAWGIGVGIILCLVIQLGNKKEYDINMFEQKSM